MKPLSDTLQVMKLPEATQKGPQHGLTTTAGKPIIPPVRAAEMERPELERRLSALLELLPSLRKQEKAKGIYSENGFEGEVLEINITGIDETDAEKLRASLLEFLRPSSENFVYKQLSLLRAQTAMQSQDETDLKLRIASYAAALAKFPDHAVVAACRKAAARGWFPMKLVELTDVCAGHVALAQSLLRQLEQKKYLEITHAPEPSHRDIPKAQWKPKHFAAYAADMLAAAKAVAGTGHKALESELSFLLAAKMAAADCAKAFVESTPFEYGAGRIAEIEAELAKIESEVNHAN